MKALLAPFRTRPRSLISIAIGVAAAVLLPASMRVVTRGLVGWNVAVWLYLLLIWTAMARLDHDRLRRLAAAQAESAGVVLAIAIGATVVSMAAIIVELAGAKDGSHTAAWQLALALATLASSWLLLPTEFALSYASRYFAGAQPEGMDFPGMARREGNEALPDYSDFLYFSLTIAATAQTSDVGVTTRTMRQLVIVQAVLSFAFNTSVLALAINMVASLF